MRCEVIYDDVTGMVLGVERPNVRYRRGGETDDELLTRMIASKAGEHPDFVGKPRLRGGDGDLPDYARVDVQGDTFSCRAAWKVVAGAVVVDDASIAPNIAPLPDRLRVVVPLAQWPAGVWADLLEASHMYERTAGQAKSYDIAMLQEVRRRLLAATTGQVRTDVQTTFDEKRVPA